MEVLLLLLIPLITMLVIYITNHKILMDLFNIVSSGLVLTLSLYGCQIILTRGSLQYDFLNHLIYVDALSGLILTITTVIFFLVSLYTPVYLAEEQQKGVVNIPKIKVFYIFLNAFLLAMMVALITQNLGVMWIAIEATTLSSAF